MKAKKYNKLQNVEDSRFEFRNDPRFKPLKPREYKVKIDKRFNRMFTDEDFSIISSKDPFGNKLVKRLDDDLTFIYKNEEVNDQQKNFSEQETATFMDTSDSEVSFKWEGESSDSSLEEEHKEDPVEVDAKLSNLHSVWENNPLHNTGITQGEPTNRLAIMGLDWDNINADDIYVVFSSFLSSSSGIQMGLSNPKLKKISIYPSQFGKERMEYENINGPKIDEKRNNLKNKIEIKNNLEEEMTEEDYEAIRKYQVEKSLYYYAIVECDETNTAIKLYDELDGMEADFCIDTVEIRFVPDNLTDFPFEPISVSTCIPIKYKRPECFTSAMRHSKPSLNWDDTPIERVKFLRKKFTPEELLKSDFDAYLGSSGSEEEMNRVQNEESLTFGGELLNENLSEMRDILLGDAKDIFDSNSDEKNADLDNELNSQAISDYEINRIFKGKDFKNRIEIEFDPDLENLSMELIAKGKKKWENEMNISNEITNNLTPWQLYLKKRKQKRKERKMQLREKIKEQRLQRERHSHDKPIENVEINSESSSVGQNYSTSDDENEDRHFDMKKIVLLERSEDKILSKKRRELIKNATSESIQKDFSGVIDDPRISKVFIDPDFAIDPTNPLYKPTEFNKKLLYEKRAQKIKRNSMPKIKSNINSKNENESAVIDESFQLVNRKKYRTK